MNMTDIIIAVILIIIAFFYHYATRNFPPPSAIENLGAAFFPNLLALILVILSILLIIESILLERAKKAKTVIDSGERLEEDSFAVETLSYPHLIGTIVLTGLYIILLPPVGYLIVTPIFLIVLIWFLGTVRWLTNILCSVLLTIILYILFHTMLGVALPSGLLFSR